MTRLSYISSIKDNLDILEYAEIEVVSNHNNKKNDISGILISFGSNFYQVIEGPDEKVQALYEKIKNDDRHSNIATLLKENTSRRQYPEWGMKHINLKDESQVLLEPIKQMLHSLTENVSKLQNSNDVIQAYNNPQFLKLLESGKQPMNAKNEWIKKIVLFTDIVSFSRIAENFEADQLTELLNTFMDTATDIINNHGGEVNKFIGDGLMASFPEELNEQAVQAAIDFNNALKEIRKNADSESPLQFLYAGFGLDKGYVIEGNFGSRQKMDYTIIGDTVNIASRLESLTRHHNKTILLSGNIINDLSDRERFENLGSYPLRGKENEIEIYALENEYINTFLSADRVSNTIALYINQLKDISEETIAI